jgi:hypothetical protein
MYRLVIEIAYCLGRKTAIKPQIKENRKYPAMGIYEDRAPADLPAPPTNTKGINEKAQTHQQPMLQFPPSQKEIPNPLHEYPPKY